MSRVYVHGLAVHPLLHSFVESEALPGSGVDLDSFWKGFSSIVQDFGPRNRRLLAERDRLQAAIDAWHWQNPAPFDTTRYREFLESVGYLLPPGSEVVVTTREVDKEVSEICGPQLVVPVTNARYALNAANARWGSLYDALYGTDVIARKPVSAAYDPARGAEVVAFAAGLLDEFVPLATGLHADATEYAIREGQLFVVTRAGRSALADPKVFAGYVGDEAAPQSILLRHNGLHIELRIDPSTPVGREHAAGLSDVILESAVTTIVDFEDSVAAVDAEDKVHAYRNWLGLNRGDLVHRFEKNGLVVSRGLNDDRQIKAPDGSPQTLPGRALLFARTVGHLMTTDAVLDEREAEIGEGILDTIMTVLTALPGRNAGNGRRNGVHGSIYIVKPKMHGPAEVEFTVELFARVEKLFGLPPTTLKLGLMDEERRTTLNLKACIGAAADRLVFINTGFLDRSGDEIHTSMEAGPVVRKAALRDQPWIKAYEDQNVDVGIGVGLVGRGQIGKGMWAMPDRMADMLAQKIAHPLAGASTAWVPSPTAATLHALHYHRVDVAERQRLLSGSHRGSLADILTLPISDPARLSSAERQEEVDNNVQSLLGYTVRWVDQGIGCSTVPDIHDVGLMEDRATLRISSQLLTNWLRHGVVTDGQVRDSLARMAAIVDEQNAGDPEYRAMAPDLNASIAFQAALELVFSGTVQPNGYTEPILHRRRREAKAAYVNN